MTRLSTSRPSSSVPNEVRAGRCLRAAVKSCASGSYGAISGAKSAIEEPGDDDRDADDRERLRQAERCRRAARRAPDGAARRAAATSSWLAHVTRIRGSITP